MDEPEVTDEDRAMMAKFDEQKAEADQLLEDPGIHTPTDEGPPDADETLPAG